MGKHRDEVRNAERSRATRALAGLVCVGALVGLGTGSALAHDGPDRDSGQGPGQNSAPGRMVSTGR